MEYLNFGFGMPGDFAEGCPHEQAIDRAYDNLIPHSLITGLVISGRLTTGFDVTLYNYGYKAA